MGKYVKKKKDMVFQSVESLQHVVNVVNEAADAVNDKSRTIRESAIPEVLAGALGAVIGGVSSFAALYGLGSAVGLSAAGITFGLAVGGIVNVPAVWDKKTGLFIRHMAVWVRMLQKDWKRWLKQLKNSETPLINDIERVMLWDILIRINNLRNCVVKY